MSNGRTPLRDAPPSSDWITLSRAARLLEPVDGVPVHPTTLYRWATRGIAGVRLEARRVGQRRLTTRGLLEEFLAEVNERTARRTRAS